MTAYPRWTVTATAPTAWLAWRIWAADEARARELAEADIKRLRHSHAGPYTITVAGPVDVHLGREELCFHGGDVEPRQRKRA